MKHTDFWPEIQDIKRRELNELLECLKQYDGSYSWLNGDGGLMDDSPIIAVNYGGCCPNPIDVCVEWVEAHQGGVEIHGVEKEYGTEVICTNEDVFAGHLSAIIDYIE